MDFGINTQKVFDNDGDTNPAFWTIFPGHVHGEVVSALTTDPAVQQAVQDKFTDPTNDKKRNAVIHHINRATVNCIGQHIVGTKLQPEEAKFTLYNLLDGGTAAAIDTVIADPANTDLHDAFAAKNAHAVISIVSRQTGRALFQTSEKQIVTFAADPIGTLKSKLPKI